MMTLTCRGLTRIGNRGRGGKILRGKMILRELASDQIGQIADPMPRARGKARRAKKAEVVQPAE